MKEDYEIRRATRQDQESIAEGWRKAYGEYEFPFQYLFPERYEWLIYGNPFLEKPGEELPIWIAKHGESVVAWTCAMEVPMELDGHTWRGAWGNLAFTLPDHRGQGLSRELQKAYPRNYDVFIGLGMSKTNRRIQYTGGGKTGKPLFVYLKLMKKFDAKTLYGTFISLVEKKCGRRWAKLFAKIGDFGPKQLSTFILSFLFKAKKRKAGAGSLRETESLSFERISEFGEAVDHLWEQARASYSFAVPRVSRYLNWKYVHQPHLHYEKYLVKNQQGDVEGLLVFRVSQPPELPVGIICELLLRREDLSQGRQVLEFAEGQLVEAGANMILCGAGSKVQCQTLEEQSFLLMYVNVPTFILAGQVKGQIDFEKVRAGEWLISLGDSDADMVHLRNQPSFGFLMRILSNKVPGFKDLEISPEEVIEEFREKVAEKANR